ncbi:MAG: hypothetical protein JW806_07475 [Sedimentisphaerales bacterium]|nr:hypothetical protein [Sedimentisphaerales bacterium]
MPGRYYNLFAALLVTLLLTQASAAPSINNETALSSLNALQSVNTSVHFDSQLTGIAASAQSRLAEIGEEFTKPSIIISGSTGTSQTSTRSLPAIPATFFMVLTGFFCVSLVKDRKAWVTALTGVLYFGLAGINAIPQLLPHHNIREEIKHSSSWESAHKLELENSLSRSLDAQGIQFTGLLHRLASIPDSDGFVIIDRLIKPAGIQSLAKKALMVWRIEYVHTRKADVLSLISAIIHNLYNLNLSPDCLAVKTGQQVYFSSEFSISYRPHGPPKNKLGIFFVS